MRELEGLRGRGKKVKRRRWEINGKTLRNGKRRRINVLTERNMDKKKYRK
jgi:hypothetical protein